MSDERDDDPAAGQVTGRTSDDTEWPADGLVDREGDPAGVVPPVVDETPTTASRLAGGLVALQGVVVLAAAVFYLVEPLVSETSSLRNVAMAVVLFLLVGGGLLLVARGLVPRRRWARAPAITWQVICLPIALGLVQSGRWYVGLPIAVVALVVLVAVLRSPPSD
ncbi:MAG TPA: hypothetical protein VFL94_08730 [Actinomycetales bacterium]|nr:hypothetical protein [Actinomycetales bacterium]